MANQSNTGAVPGVRGPTKDISEQVDVAATANGGYAACLPKKGDSYGYTGPLSSKAEQYRK